MDCGKYDVNLLAIFTNEHNQSISVKVDNVADSMLPSSVYSFLVQLYGEEMTNAAVNGKVKVGMHKDLLIVSWGYPDKVNRSSVGPDQWVYDGQYIYLENNVVTAFN